MSGTAEPPDASRAPADGGYDDVVAVEPRGPRGRWWLVVALVVAVVVLLVWRPWAQEPAPAPSASPSPSPSPSAPTTETTPSPDSPTTATATAAPVPGADAVFDATTVASLFVTAADVEAGVPAAAAGVVRGVEPGTRPWGLPAGAAVVPASCTLALTVVEAPPAHHDATSWVNDEVTFDQDIVLLADAAAARAAFRALVMTVDGCPEYELVLPHDGATRWEAEPAIEGQGVFPAIVHDVTQEATGDDLEQTIGHVLVGNTIVTWTATALGASDRQQAQTRLGEPAELSAMVEQRALTAVRALT